MGKLNYYHSTSLFKSFNVQRESGHSVQVVFNYNSAHNKGEYITEDTEMQSLVEKRKEFVNGEITLYRTIETARKEQEMVETKTSETSKPATGVKKEVKAEVIEKAEEVTGKEIPEVTNYNEAKDYLRSIGIHHLKLTTPEKINAQAKEAGVIFPNLLK